MKKMPDREKWNKFDTDNTESVWLKNFPELSSSIGFSFSGKDRTREGELSTPRIFVEVSEVPVVSVVLDLGWPRVFTFTKRSKYWVSDISFFVLD